LPVYLNLDLDLSLLLTLGPRWAAIHRMTTC
jgi:hypothetical protein